MTHESVRGTTGGGYLITGTFDGRTVKLTEPAKVNDGSLSPRPREHDVTSPCPVPAGGWRPVDPANTTGNALQSIKVVVSADPDFAGLWLDRPNDPGSTDNDPVKLLLNVRFTKDLARHEAAIRRVWGGALCLSEVTHTLAELTQIRQERAVEITVYVATQTRQRELDAKYGRGLVNLVGALEPIN